MEDKSNLTWNEAQFLLQQGKWNSAANRLYFAVFQSVYGFGRKRNIITDDTIDRKGRHKPTQDIVKAHLRDCSVAYGLLFGLRVTADYHPEEVTQDNLSEYLKQKAERIRDYFVNMSGTTRV